MLGVCLEVVIALVAGMLVGLVLNKTLSSKRRHQRFKSFVGKLTLFLTYALVFLIGLRISQVLPDILSRGQHVVLALLAFSAIPTLLSFMISYLVLRG